MSKEKLEKDFKDFNSQIDKLAEEELKNIKEKAEAIKAEVGKIGENVELSMKQAKPK
jgi:hypothetical protein